jgi:hypothetical protein
MITLETSSIQAKDIDRAMLARAMDGYLAKGNVIQVVPTSRSLFNPIPFNSEPISPSTYLSPGTESDPARAKRNRAAKAQKSASAQAFEAGIAEKMRDYYDLGVVAAAKDLHISARRASQIAATYGVKFASRASAAAREEDRQLLPQIRQCIFEGMSQEQMCARLGIGRTSLKRIAGQNGLRFRQAGDKEKELALVERIKAVKELGCTRAACARHLGLNAKVLIRLIDKYLIDYPVRGRGES